MNLFDRECDRKIIFAHYLPSFDRLLERFSILDQDNSDGNHRNESNEVASTSSSSTSNVDVEVMNPQQIESNNINEEYCNNPVKKNDDLTHFELSNIEFRRALQQNENRKACGKIIKILLKYTRFSNKDIPQVHLRDKTIVKLFKI